MLSAQQHVVMLDFETPLCGYVGPLLAEGVEERVLEVDQFGIDANPVLDVARIAASHCLGLARQQRFVLISERISIHAIDDTS